VFYTILNEEYNDLSTLYWIPKLHTFRERYITSSTCSTKMSITLTKNSVCSPRGIVYCDNGYSPSSINNMWILKNSKDLLDDFDSLLFSKISSIQIFDFSTLETTSHKKEKKNSLKEIIHNTFYFKDGWQGYMFIVLGHELLWYVKHETNEDKKSYTEKGIS
jgi:hypothetical protein